MQRWTTGPSVDGKGAFSFLPAMPLGGEPQLAPPIPEGHAQTEEMKGAMTEDIDRPLRR
jgi:Mn-containing catalase